MAEPKITQTEVLKLNKPDPGYFDWADTINENWDKLDILGAGQLPLLSPLELRRALSDAESVGWALQGSVLDGAVHKGVWDIVYAARQRASIKYSRVIRDVTYYFYRDLETGMVFVDEAEYTKALGNLGDSLGYICTNADGKKVIRLPADRSFNLPMLDADGKPGDFLDEALPNFSGKLINVSSGTQGINPSAEGGVKYMNTGYANQGGGYGISPGRGDFTVALNNSSPTYQDGALVRPRSHQVWRYYKVGNTVINKEEIDLGAVLNQLAELQANSAKTDFSNVLASAWEKIQTKNRPDYSKGESATFNSGTPFKAAKACVVFLTMAQGVYTYSLYVNGSLLSTPVQGEGDSHGGRESVTTLELDVGDVLSVSAGSAKTFRWFPLKGA